jgi:hypothetical protein
VAVEALGIHGAHSSLMMLTVHAGGCSAAEPMAGLGGEFAYVVEGECILLLNGSEHPMKRGCAVTILRTRTSSCFAGLNAASTGTAAPTLGKRVLFIHNCVQCYWTLVQARSPPGGIWPPHSRPLNRRDGETCHSSGRQYSAGLLWIGWVFSHER